MPLPRYGANTAIESTYNRLLHIGGCDDLASLSALWVDETVSCDSQQMTPTMASSTMASLVMLAESLRSLE